MATGLSSDAGTRGRGDTGRRVALGEPLAWSDADLDAMTQIGPADIAAAEAWWRTHAPRRYRRLLDAEDAARMTTEQGV